MSLTTSVIFTVIGGLVAGGVGYIATVVSLREQRKMRHLEDHKNNLKAVYEALDQLWREVWPFVYGSESLKLPKPTFGNAKRVETLEIKNEPIAMEPSNQFSRDNSTIQVRVDSILYDDIIAHFTNLHQYLDETEREVKEKGLEILKLLNLISANIYEKLESSNFDFPYVNGNEIKTKKFINLNNEAIETDYAGDIFLWVIGDDEDNWPNQVRFLKSNNIYDKLKPLAKEIETEFVEDLKQLREFHDQIFQHINETKEAIDKIEHTTKLKGSCMYF